MCVGCGFRRGDRVSEGGGFGGSIPGGIPPVNHNLCGSRRLVKATCWAHPVGFPRHVRSTNLVPSRQPMVVLRLFTILSTIQCTLREDNRDVPLCTTCETLSSLGSLGKYEPVRLPTGEVTVCTVTGCLLVANFPEVPLMSPIFMAKP